jgi:CTD small phosphatase-like protein 2
MGCLDLESIQIDHIEPRENFQGNYNNYVYQSLRSSVSLSRINTTGFIRKTQLQECAINRKTLVLDLDETLIHADFDGVFQGHDHQITFLHADEEVTVPIFLRPGLQEFLEKCSKQFEIFVFTASKQVYADAVLNLLDPDNRIFKQRFYRESCIKVAGKLFLKDLRIFGNRRLEDIILVDNSMYSLVPQLSNGVLINSFYNDKEDRELLNLLNYLENYLRDAADVRLINEKVFNFKSILESFRQEEEAYIY